MGIMGIKLILACFKIHWTLKLSESLGTVDLINLLLSCQALLSLHSALRREGL